MSKKLMEKGHSITVVTRGSYRTIVDHYEGIRVIKVRFMPLYPFHVHIHGIFIYRLLKKIGHEFDLIHVHTPLVPVVYPAALPVISTVHTSMIEDAKHTEIVDLKSLLSILITRPITYPLVFRLMEVSRAITTVSYSVADEIRRYYGFEDVIVVRNGVDERRFVPAGRKDGEQYVLCVGRLSYRKGLFDVIETAKIVCSRHDIKFLVVGKGELEGKLKEKIAAGGLEGKVVLLGHVDPGQLVRLYQNATIFLMPSHYEGLPTTLLEAAACGLPIVATAVSGNIEVIASGENGILVPPKSPAGMSDAISRLLEDEPLRKRLGAEARMTIESDFTWDRISEKILKCYRSLLKQEDIRETMEVPPIPVIKG